MAIFFCMSSVELFNIINFEGFFNSCIGHCVGVHSIVMCHMRTDSTPSDASVQLTKSDKGLGLNKWRQQYS